MSNRERREPIVNQTTLSPGREDATAGDLLFWQATRYLLQEMSEAEAAAWEVHLESDEAACLAVAEASRLMCGLAEVCGLAAVKPVVPAAVSVVGSPRVRKGAFRRTLLALAGSVAVVMLLSVGLRPSVSDRLTTAVLPDGGDPDGGDPDGGDSDNDDEDAVQLVGLWRTSGVRSSPDVSPRTGLESDEREFIDLDSEIDDVGSPPGWMLAAVSLERGPAEVHDGDDVWENQ
jgi:hypothetical protein